MRKMKEMSCMKKALGLICVIAMCLLHYERGYAMEEDMEYLRECMEERLVNSEARQYEMNIVLDELYIKMWKSMPYALDDIEFMEELGETPDAPLGEYSPEKLKEYTDEDIQVKFEYCYGHAGRRDDFSQLIQIVWIYDQGELYTMGYYGWMRNGVVNIEDTFALDKGKVNRRCEESETYFPKSDDTE